jgi:hypothetical protein
MRLWAARTITARRPEIATSAPEAGRRNQVNTERSGSTISRARNSNSSSCKNRNMEDQTSRPSATEPKRHRKRNRGPWNCELCQRPPFGSISGFRNHVILNHGKDCSWTGVIRAPQSAEQLSQLVERAKRSRGHRERNHKRPRISVDGSDDTSVAEIETGRASPRVCRIRLASPPLNAAASDNRPPRDPPTRPPPLDLTTIPAEIDVLEAIERRFVCQRELIGRRPPSPPISYLVDGSGYATIDISDTEFEVGTTESSTSSENGLD